MDSNKRACLAFIIGRAKNQNYQSVYDFGANSFTTVNMNGSSFSGFDYGTTSYFSGNVNGNVVMIYDGKNSSYNTYSLV